MKEPKPEPKRTTSLTAQDAAKVRAGRKKIAEWHKEVDARIRAGRLIDFDGRLVRALSNFPSATLEGRCWVGQTRLSATLNRSDRTIRSSLARLRSELLLQCKQRGNGRSCRYTFCIDGMPLIVLAGSDWKSTSGSNRKDASGLELPARKDASDKSNKRFDSNEQESPLTPNPPKLELGRERGPVREVSFADFWDASRGNSARNDKVGPARAQWLKLPLADRCEIESLVKEGAIDLKGQWTSVWLKSRCWRERALKPSGPEFKMISSDRAPARRLVAVSPGDPLFEDEYRRRLKAGEPVGDMELAQRRRAKFTLLLRDGDGHE